MKRLIAIVAALAALSGCATFPGASSFAQRHQIGAAASPEFWMDASGAVHDGAPPTLAQFRSVLRVGIRYGQPSSAISLVDCAVNTACTQSGPVNTGTGDPAYLAFGKLNGDFQQVENMFGATGLLVGNGDIPNPLTAATYSNVVSLWSGCASGTPLLSYTGSCVAGGSSSQTWPTNAGIMVYSGSQSFGTSYSATNAIPANYLPAALSSSNSINGTSVPASAGTLLATGSSAASFPTLNQSTTGNAATATALATTPTTCTSTQAATGILANGNATGCFTPSGSGTVNAAAQYSAPYYSAAGSSSTISGLASPTSGPGYFDFRYDPTSTTAVAPTLDQEEVGTRSISGSATTDTVAYSDLFSVIVHDKAATGTVNETLPTPTTLNNAHFGYTYCNNSAQTDTITPTTWTIAVNNGTAGASASIGSGVCAQIVVDPFNSTQWDAWTYGASAAGSAAFSAITAGTNTAALVMGSGGSLSASGTGSITATNYLPSVNTATSGTSVAPDCAYPEVQVTVSTGTAFSINAPATCTPVNGQRLRLLVTSSSSGAPTYTWATGAAGDYIGSTTVTLPTTGGGTSTVDAFEFEYSSGLSRWMLMAYSLGY